MFDLQLFFSGSVSRGVPRIHFGMGYYSLRETAIQGAEKPHVHARLNTSLREDYRDEMRWQIFGAAHLTSKLSIHEGIMMMMMMMMMMMIMMVMRP